MNTTMKLNRRSGAALGTALALLASALATVPAQAESLTSAPLDKTAGGEPATYSATTRRSGPVAQALTLMPTVAPAQRTPSAAARMSGLGPENSRSAQRAGTWDVVETVWASPGAAPTSTKAVAERTMIGSFLQEIIHPALGSAGVLRVDYLSFNRVEGRWKYVSMDTRAPVGIMSAQSFGRGGGGRIDLTFQPFALAGSGTNVTGQLLQMNQLIIRQDANHDRKDQYFVVADGNGRRWLAHRYAYVRRL